MNRMWLGYIASGLGDAELAFELFRESGHGDLLNACWLPMNRAIRQLPAFKTYVRDIGLNDYWRATNKWPDLCHPVGKDDFVCE